MLILHVITNLGSGGAERMLSRIATHDFGSDRLRQVVMSLTDEGVHGPALRDAGIEVQCLGMHRGSPAPTAVLRLARMIRNLKPDLVMTWLYHADFLGTLAAPLAGSPPVIWNLRCSDLDLSHHPRTTRWTVAALTRLSRRPSAVAFNSVAGQRVHAKFGYRPRRWAHLPNGFDIEEWHPDIVDREAVRRELGFENGEIAIGLVARVHPEKDHATFLAAAAQVAQNEPKARFVLIGLDTEKLDVPSALRGRLVALGERQDVARLLRGLDIATLCSHSEGFPNVVGETMASGLPCIVTDVGDAAAIVGDTGIVVSPRDPNAFASAIAAMIEGGETHRAMRGQAARERIRQNWSIARAAQGYRTLWLEVLDR